MASDTKTHKPMTLPDLVISTQWHPYSHTSSFIQLDDGRILHASGGVWNSSDDGGLTWSDQQWLKDRDGGDIFATTLLKLPDGKESLGLVGKIRDEPPLETPYPDFESGSRVVALAVPLEGSMWARIAGWARFAFPRQLRDLSPGSPALSQLRERVRQLPGWMGLRLSGDPLSGRPPVPLTGSHRDYQVPALMSPWSRHREVHADPRIIRDVIVALRSETLAEDA